MLSRNQYNQSLIALLGITDIIAYFLPIYTSIYWLQTNDNSDQFIHLLSFSCLFLDFKFLLFFRAFESFGVYFAIIISVGKQIISFLVVLFIIIMSFAHAFHILLSPRTPVSFDDPIDFSTNSDEFNPWNVASVYRFVDNGTVDSNQFIIQQPDENTNMFVDYGTSLFAMYLFLTGMLKYNCKCIKYKSFFKHVLHYQAIQVR